MEVSYERGTPVHARRQKARRGVRAPGRKPILVKSRCQDLEEPDARGDEHGRRVDVPLSGNRGQGDGHMVGRDAGGGVGDVGDDHDLHRLVGQQRLLRAKKNCR